MAVPDTDESHNPELRSCVLDFMLYHFELPAKEALAKVPEAMKPFSRAIVKVLLVTLTLLSHVLTLAPGAFNRQPQGDCFTCGETPAAHHFGTPGGRPY